MSNICLRYLILINIIKQERTGGVFLIFVQENLSLFDSLGLTRLKYFIVDNDEAIIDKLLYNFSLCKVKEERLTLCSLRFSINGWEKLKPSEKEKLTDATQNFFHLLTKFAKLKENKRHDYFNSRTSNSRNN